jgi:hypothetical protein
MVSANIGASTDATAATLPPKVKRPSLAVGAGDRDEQATRTPSPSDKHDRRMAHQSY